MSPTRIVVDTGNVIDVWVSALGIGVEIISEGDSAGAFLSADQADELIHALAEACVKLSKARPRCP